MLESPHHQHCMPAKKPTTTDKRASLGPLDTLIGYHLRRASLVFYPDYRKTKGVRQGLVGILSIVAANPGINQISVGKLLLIDAGNLVELIDDLVSKGLLERSVDPMDRRSRSLTITAAGAAQLKEILERIKKMEKNMLGKLTTRERETLLDLLKRIHTSDVSPNA